MTENKFGFIGLGQMGGPMASNISAKGFPLTVYDKAGTEILAPKGTIIASSVSEVARTANTIFLSVPDGSASLILVDEILACTDRCANVVIDLSTIGPVAAREANEKCLSSDVTYIDAPVSGGQAGARAGTITVMLAGPKHQVETHNNVLHAFSKNSFHVGEEPGQGQALKILNNFLSGTAMVATTEAILYGLSQGLDFKTMLDVVNVSTGQNTATTDKFPNRIMPETFDAGFATALVTKDINLFFDNASEAKTPTKVAEAIKEIWDATNEALPGSDFSMVYKYLRDQAGTDL